ncbi:YciI family protein [Nocardioides sp.]|uniref:YciI family protein n=1 Tax=Nocardioides sp. TaxID=35761 RepID=UPI003784ECA4
MSSYVLIVSYTAPLRAVDAAMPAHRRFLDEHFATGEFLASGPRAPRVGGVILARFDSRARLTSVIAADPFVRQGLATYQVIAFHPTRGPFALPMSDPTASIPGP